MIPRSRKEVEARILSEQNVDDIEALWEEVMGFPMPGNRKPWLETEEDHFLGRNDGKR